VERAISLDVFGRHVNKASRICSQAKGEQVLLSYPVYDSAFGWVKGAGYENIEWTYLGEFPLKGFPDQERIYGVFDKSPSRYAEDQGVFEKSKKGRKGRKFLETFKVSRSSLSIYLGDITDLKVDAIVSSDDVYLTMGGGVSGRIWDRGGDAIKMEAKKHTPVPLGQSVVTTAGNLNAKYVFHAAVLGLRPKKRPDPDTIRAVTTHCLQNAKRLGIQSIAFPALGTGAGRLHIERCVHAMTSQIHLFLAETKKKMQVVLALRIADELSGTIRRIVEQEVTIFNK
ncbi:macro domain-containing protein, partial [Candidatus Neomarinimicrobiota bacterium]